MIFWKNILSHLIFSIQLNAKLWNNNQINKSEISILTATFCRMLPITNNNTYPSCNLNSLSGMCESRKSRTKPHHQRPDCCFWKSMGCYCVLYSTKKAAFCMCERKMLLCKVQNSIASRRLHYTILLGGIFGMKSTFRLKKDFYLVFFLSGRKKMLEKTHMQKKNLSSGGLDGYLF